MSEANTITVAKPQQLVPKGSKRCPACSQLVKGPRTLKCPHCEYQFGTKKPVKVKIVPAIPATKSQATDPYTFRLNTVDNSDTLANSTVNVNVGGHARRPKALAKVVEYLTGVAQPEFMEVPNFITMA